MSDLLRLYQGVQIAVQGKTLTGIVRIGLLFVTLELHARF